MTKNNFLISVRVRCEPVIRTQSGPTHDDVRCTDEEIICWLKRRERRHRPYRPFPHSPRDEQGKDVGGKPSDGLIATRHASATPGSWS